MKESKGKDLLTIRQGDSYSLATARKESGRESIEALIAQFVLVTAEDLNLIGKISERSVMTLAEDIYDTAYYVKVEELAYFFRQLRKGEFGPMYQTFNSLVVCSALSKFIAERAMYFERKNQGTHYEEMKNNPILASNSEPSSIVEFNKKVKEIAHNRNLKNFKEKNTK